MPLATGGHFDEANVILVDSRAGSSDLLPHLMARGLPALMAKLDYGDVAFTGNGPDGPVSVGIEYKRTNDALQCMSDSRFTGHQLPGMLQSYQYSWLLIEGITRVGDDGTLQMRAWPEGWKSCRQGSHYIHYRDFAHWLMSLQQMTPLRVAQTSCIKETATWLGSLYSWWSKDWDKHRTIASVYVPPLNDGRGPLAGIAHGSPSLSRLWAMQLPGIGQDRSKTAAMAFPTALELATADEDRWQLVDGIGKTLAKKIVTSIRERAK